ncbi:MAG: motility associated factor glycosyltransferase family protein [Lachnospiraceae bacterium]|nr:motility associated factor glycosyltransferase family protein [Lachnospiraceae bacterium]
MKKCWMETAQDGNPVPAMEINGTARTLGSRYDGGYAARVWIDCHVSAEVENMILFGLGDGQLVLALLEAVPGSILVYEPEEEVYSLLKNKAVCKKINAQRRVSLFCGERQKGRLEEALRRMLNEDNVDTTMLAAHPAYSGLYEEEKTALNEICENICNQIGLMKKPIQRFIEAMLYNQLHNIQYMEAGVPAARLKRHWPKEIPVVLVSAGPSLEKNVEVLKEKAGRAYIFCADATLPLLLERGVVPDLAACTDAKKNMNCFEKEESLDIPLLVTANSPAELLKKSRGVRLWGDDHEFIQILQEQAGLELPKVPFYSGVSTALFATLMELGVRKVILVGQDLAYSPEGKSHISGREEKYVKNEAYRIEGYYGDMVYSRGDWVSFRNWFEKAILAFPKCEVINATEGGAHIHGAIQRPLAEVMEELPEYSKTFQEVLEPVSVHISSEEYRKLMEGLSHCQSDIEKIKQDGYDKTFFENNCQPPVLRLVIDYMKSLEEPGRRARFEKAVDYVSDLISASQSGMMEKRNAGE